ncbi:ABC-type multidrug transport system fused ATPase/permease subunit [Rhizobium sp. BK538]|nr:ABC-type multidrug transport system fused ATPase/permease subunit [Rhizobium sp. BK538]
MQAFANENYERTLFEKDNQSYRRVKLDAYKLMAASSSLSYMSMRLTQMVVMIAGAYFVLSGNLTAGGFIGFLLLVGVFSVLSKRSTPSLKPTPRALPASDASPSLSIPSQISPMHLMPSRSIISTAKSPMRTFPLDTVRQRRFSSMSM